MVIHVEKVEVWAGEVRDEPGGAATALEAIAAAGAAVECVISRRQPEKPRTAVLFVTPVKGKKAQAAAREVGLSPAPNVFNLRIQTTWQTDIAVQITRRLEQEGLNLRGLSSMTVEGQFVAYLGFDSDEDVKRAMQALKASRSKTQRRSP
jgi:hypothetical protein